jgi:hypothetical protein
VVHPERTFIVGFPVGPHRLEYAGAALPVKRLDDIVRSAFDVAVMHFLDAVPPSDSPDPCRYSVFSGRYRTEANRGETCAGRASVQGIGNGMAQTPWLLVGGS